MQYRDPTPASDRLLRAAVLALTAVVAMSAIALAVFLGFATPRAATETGAGRVAVMSLAVTCGFHGCRGSPQAGPVNVDRTEGVPDDHRRRPGAV